MAVDIVADCMATVRHTGNLCNSDSFKSTGMEFGINNVDSVDRAM